MNIKIAIIGEDSDAEDVLFLGFKYFMPEKVILLVKKDQKKKVEKIKKNLDVFNINYDIREVSNFLELEEVFVNIKNIYDLYKNDSLVINVDTDYMSSCLALSSAFVNGILAIGMLEDKIITYPIMKFSYYNAINEKKMYLLNIINKKEEIESMEELSKLSGMSLPLIAYHLSGNRDSKGLVEMNLVETKRDGASIKIKLTQLGRLISANKIDVSSCSVSNKLKKKK